MKKSFSLLYSLIILLACESPQQDPAHFYMPAEYEAHSAVWLSWVDYPPYEQPFLDLANALYPKVPLKILGESDSSLHILRQKLTRRGLDTSNIFFQVASDSRLWIRDHGTTYLVNDLGEKRGVDFGWTLYGYQGFLENYFEGNTDSVSHYLNRRKSKTGLIDSLMLAAAGHTVVKSSVNMEGGSIEVNGKGTLILCEAVTFQRNPGRSREELEAEFKAAMGVSHIVWLKEGLADDPLHFNHIVENYYGWGTYGHTDEFVRFVNDNTLLLAWVDSVEAQHHPIDSINYLRMAENLRILEAARDQDGKPFKIVKVPLPDPMFIPVEVREYDERPSGLDWHDSTTWSQAPRWPPREKPFQVGDTLFRAAASSYLNYLVTNDVVILPTYLPAGSSPEKEARVKEIFSEYFPDRELVFLEVMNLNYHGGGIHCITQQEPKVKTP